MLNEHDYELLSAYIDGELNDSERAALETRLQSEVDLRRELATLRQTVTLVSQLPKLKAPRDFTLDKSITKSRTLPFPMTAAFSAISAAAAFLLIIFGGYLLTISTNANTSASSPILAYDAELQVAQAPMDTQNAQDGVSQAPAPQIGRESTDEIQNQDVLEPETAQATEASLADSIPYAIALPTMTQNAQTGLADGQGGAAADQAVETTDFFAATAPPSPGEDLASSAITMQESADSSATEHDEGAANSAADLTQAIPPQPAATTTSMPTMVAQAEEATVQRAMAATASPAPAMPPTASPAPTIIPTAVPQSKAAPTIDINLIGLVSIIVGIIFLIAALATTLIRRRRKMA